MEILDNAVSPPMALRVCSMWTTTFDEAVFVVEEMAPSHLPVNETHYLYPEEEFKFIREWSSKKPFGRNCIGGGCNGGIIPKISSNLTCAYRKYLHYFGLD